MAGIGTKLTNIFEKDTVTTDLIGFGYSSISTVAPMFAVILNILLMGHFLKFSELGFVERELFSCTVLYIFRFMRARVCGRGHDKRNRIRRA